MPKPFTKIYTQYYAYISREILSKEYVSLVQDSITCKLCNAKFDSLGDMQRHTLTEHIQKGDLKENSGL